MKRALPITCLVCLLLGCAVNSRSRLLPRPDDRYVGGTAWSVYPWRNDVLRQAPDSVRVMRDSEGWTIQMPEAGGAAVLSQTRIYADPTALQFSGLVGNRASVSNVQAILRVHEGQNVRRIADWTLRPDAPPQSLEATVEVASDQPVWFDLRLLAGPAEIRISHLQLQGRDGGSILPGALITVDAAVVEEGNAVVLRRHADPSLGTDAVVRYRVLDSQEIDVASGELSDERENAELHMPIGWYRLITATDDPSGPFRGTASFSVVPRRNDRPSVHSPFGLHVTATPDGAELATQLGAGWVRWHGADILKWTAVQPSEGRWRFPDAQMQYFIDRDLNMLGVLGLTPRWASREPDATPYPNPSTYFGSAAHPARDLEDWGAYVNAVTTRYSGAIDYWEVWNEPDIHFLVGGPLGKVEDYRQLWDRARESAAASSKLVGPTVAYFATTDGVSPGSRRFPESEFSRYRNANFLNDLLGTTDAPDFENFSFHHYANLDESLQILTDSLESKLARLGNFSQEVDQVWATESNVLNRGSSTEDELELAARLVRDHLAMLSHGVHRVFAYAAFGPMHGELYGTRFSNFFRNGSPTPRLSAYAVLTSQVETPEIPIAIGYTSLDEGELYSLPRADGQHTLVWYAGSEDWMVTAPFEGTMWTETAVLRPVQMGDEVTIPAKRLMYLVPLEG